MNDIFDIKLTSSLAWTSAPDLINSSATARLFLPAALCNGVYPYCNALKSLLKILSFHHNLIVS